MMEMKLLKGRYEPITAMGAGETAQMYLCQDLHLDRQVAVKRAKKSDPAEVKALKQERDLMLSLFHPGIAAVLDFFAEGDYWYLITALTVGEADRKRKPEFPAADGRRGWEGRTICWGIQICEILEYLHTRKLPIVYGDLKPAKLMIGAEGQVFLADFGSAFRLRPGKKRKKRKMKSGSAKEVSSRSNTEKQGEIALAADLYALGETLKILLAGVQPSPGLAFVINRCLDPEPKKRFRSARSVRIALEILAFFRY